MVKFDFKFLCYDINLSQLINKLLMVFGWMKQLEKTIIIS